jgi:hypothetical protein
MFKKVLTCFASWLYAGNTDHVILITHHQNTFPSRQLRGPGGAMFIHSPLVATVLSLMTRDGVDDDIVSLAKEVAIGATAYCHRDDALGAVWYPQVLALMPVRGYIYFVAAIFT